MVIEAIRRGEVRMAELRLAIGPEIRSLREVEVIALSDDGQLVRASVKLCTLRFGRAVTPAFVCPTCSSPKRVLVARGGLFRCNKCHPRRTRRQLERHLRSWRLGGKLEDRMLRLLDRCTHPRVEEATAIASTLLRADLERLAVIERELADLVLAQRSR